MAREGSGGVETKARKGLRVSLARGTARIPKSAIVADGRHLHIVETLNRLIIRRLVTFIGENGFVINKLDGLFYDRAGRDAADRGRFADECDRSDRRAGVCRPASGFSVRDLWS